MSIKINRFEIENTKRVKAVVLSPSKNGLTIIGGKNRQGKTSVLDSIAWALGGNKFRPDTPKREGSVTDPYLKVQLSNGLIVERKGKNSDLVVTDPSGERAGQRLLDSFISELALDLPKFMEMTSKEKAKTLLNLVGIGDELKALEDEEERLYNQRRSVGQLRDRKEKSIEEMTYYPEVPSSPISISDLIQKQQAILAKNGRNHELRQQNKELAKAYEESNENIQEIQGKIKALQQSLEEAYEENAQLLEKLEVSSKTVKELQDESTEEIEQSISAIELTNAQVMENQKRMERKKEADELNQEYIRLSEAIEEARKSQISLLNGVKMPLDGLSVKDGELTYQGFTWDSMSNVEQLKVSAAIVRALNPECGFVLMDKLEAFDQDELKDFGEWLEKENLQVIATRVSNGEECTIIISDGFIQGEEMKEEKQKTKNWEAGKF